MDFFEARVLTERDPVRVGVPSESSFREAIVPSVAHVIDWFSSVVVLSKDICPINMHGRIAEKLVDQTMTISSHLLIRFVKS